jgi:hypothetical protein
MTSEKYNMKHLMRYDGYTSRERTDEILDKISKYGIDSVTILEKKFLDSYSIGKEEELHDILSRTESETVFEDDNGLFKFEFDSKEEYENEVHYLGTFYVPDLKLKNGEIIDGRLIGRIVVYSDGSISPDFYSTQKYPKSVDYYDIFEFCYDLEDKLDSFLDYIVSELEQKYF